MHIVIDIVNILLYKYMLACVKIQSQSPSIEIGRLLSNCLNNMSLNLEIR